MAPTPTCDAFQGYAAESAWWLDRVFELRSESPEPLTRACLLNYQRPDLGMRALCTFPHVGLTGVRFFDSQHGSRRNDTLDASLSLPGRRVSLRSVDFWSSQVVPPASSEAIDAGHCDLLVIDISPPADVLRRTDVHGAQLPWSGASFTQSLLIESAHALELAAKVPASVLVVHGPPCNESARYLSADNSLELALCWRTFIDEKAAAGSLASAECRENGAGGDARSPSESTCVARVRHTSICSSMTPLMSAKGGRLEAIKQKVAFRTGSEAANRLLTQSARYFVALPCYHGARTCLLFKDAAYESWVGGLASSDGGLTFTGAPSLLMPSMLRVTENELKAANQWSGRTRLASLTHNFAVVYEPSDGSYMFVGGKFHVRRPIGNGNTGIWSATWRQEEKKGGGGGDGSLLDAWARTDTWHYWNRTLTRRLAWRLRSAAAGRKAGGGGGGSGSSAELPTLAESKWRSARLLLTGQQKGCIERRSVAIAPWVHNNACEFDGRLSIARSPNGNGQTLLLYTRANMASHGARHVQLTSSKDGGATWTKFKPVVLGGGYEPSSADIYFFNVVLNPATNGTSLLALYPLVMHFRACVCLSASLDGRRWSAPQPLLRCGIAGERATSHPAAGLIERGEQIDFYVHEAVPEIHSDFRTPQTLTRFWKRKQKQMSSRLARYTVARAKLAEWTAEALTTLPPEY